MRWWDSTRKWHNQATAQFWKFFIIWMFAYSVKVKCVCLCVLLASLNTVSHHHHQKKKMEQVILPVILSRLYIYVTKLENDNSINLVFIFLPFFFSSLLFKISIWTISYSDDKCEVWAYYLFPMHIYRSNALDEWIAINFRFSHSPFQCVAFNKYFFSSVVVVCLNWWCGCYSNTSQLKCI